MYRKEETSPRDLIHLSMEQKVTFPQDFADVLQRSEDWLTHETFQALRHTCRDSVGCASYMLQCPAAVNYVPLDHLQSDATDSHFSQPWSKLFNFCRQEVTEDQSILALSSIHN